MTNNILVCSAGRRVELVKAFRSSLEQYRPEGKVFCTDMHPELSSACHVADAFFKAVICSSQTGHFIKRHFVVQN
ncbi:hypothetical protein CGJ84_04140 [Vibrio parahaemolyticus]|uniref:hypothetical protein n=1 Tax=Vibrio parahaemolyticus TaxID=670 RepID=UPI001175993C|nr:hypothetical protein [Vibrio parahaemolyticus]TOC49897.1 hypothetical protein CGJ84_04140 [Vibrio parahaemolyticus]